MPPSQGVKRVRTRRTRSDVSLDALTEVVGLSAEASAEAGPSPRSGPAPRSGAPVGRRPAAETSRGGYKNPDGRSGTPVEHAGRLTVPRPVRTDPVTGDPHTPSGAVHRHPAEGPASAIPRLVTRPTVRHPVKPRTERGRTAPRASRRHRRGGPVPDERPGADRRGTVTGRVRGDSGGPRPVPDGCSGRRPAVRALWAS